MQKSLSPHFYHFFLSTSEKTVLLTNTKSLEILLITESEKKQLNIMKSELRKLIMTVKFGKLSMRWSNLKKQMNGLLTLPS